MPPAYHRAIKMFDEAHAPETLDQFVASGHINTGKFLSEAHAQSYLLQMQTLARRKDVRKAAARPS
ncbi:MAG: hypothetical protein LDL27_09790 [Desulfovibrio sp.]|nr:hypothetical protein [Desulfovibrio sp.]